MITTSSFYKESVSELLVSYKSQLIENLEFYPEKIASIIPYIPGLTSEDKKKSFQNSFIKFLDKLSEGVIGNDNVFLLNKWEESLLHLGFNGMISFHDFMHLDSIRKQCLFASFELVAEDVKTYRALVRETENVFAQLADHTFKVYYRICYNKLLENSQQFKEMIDSHGNGILVYNKDFQITIFNPKLEEITGILKEDAAGKNFFEVFPQYLNSPEASLLHKVLDGKRYLLSDRKILDYPGYYHISLAPLIGNKGPMAGVITIQDVTKKKDIEIKLKESEYFIQQVLDNSPDFIYIMDEQNNSVVFNNSRVKDVVGYSAEEIKSFGSGIIQALVHPEDQALVRSRKMKLKNLGDTKVIEAKFRLKKKDGSYMWVLSRGKVFKRNADGEAALTLNIGSDITEKKKTESDLLTSRNELARAYQELSNIYKGLVETNENLERKVRVRTKELAESERQYRFLAESVPQIFWTCDNKGHADYFNSRWYEYTGLTYEESKDDGWLQAIHPDDRKKALKVWKDSVASGNKYETEYRIRRGADQEYIWHVSRGAALKDDDNKVIRWFGSNFDIHERKKAMEELKYKNKELRKINNDLDNFIYTASHDLKTPIANIEGLVNMLEQDVRANHQEDINAEMNMIRESILRFKIIIKDLEEIGKIQRNTPKDVSLNNIADVVNGIRMAVKSELEICQGEIELDQQSFPHVLFSKTDLTSILYNLINNSIKYRSPERRLHIRINAQLVNEDTIVIIVSDNGIGIPPSQKEKIFQMFRKAHSHVQGSGVGLYIVKRIMDNHEGTVEMESEQNAGTTFKLYFKNQADAVQKYLFREA